MSRSSVDLPQPDGPMSETNSPDPIVRSMPSSAVTADGPVPNRLPAPAMDTTSRAEAWGGGLGVGSVMGLRSMLRCWSSSRYWASVVRYLPRVRRSSATRTMPTNARPTNVHMMIVTHSRDGAVT